MVMENVVLRHMNVELMMGNVVLVQLYQIEIVKLKLSLKRAKEWLLKIFVKVCTRHVGGLFDK